MHNIFHINAIAPRQQRTHISTITLTLITIMTIDRPRRQCSRSSICQSPRSVSTTFSVARRSTGAVALTLTLIMTIDRPCRRCSRSSICQSSWSVSVNPVNSWIQSNATSKNPYGTHELASQACKTRSLVQSVNIVTTVTMHMNGNKLQF